MEKYDHSRIEKKWQDIWEESGIYAADDTSTNETRYVLDMFPYPSGAGLHTGHVEGYTATDVASRYMRMKGHTVLHPMGFDSFGLPAENYAIKTGVHPSITTEEAITNFTKQMKSLGFSYDWSREIAAHRPDYYKWTQWFFLLMYQNGLAEKKKAKVNWCPNDQTVLANEQVVDGKCERCGAVVVQKDLEQWFFKITKYADQLIEGLDAIDWPESTKTAQRHWIGRSEGAEIDFKIAGGDETITVFTTRPDTLFGATYLVLAPESQITKELAARAENKTEVDAYVAATASHTDLERAESKEKTGVELKGIKAINPANNEEIPVWIADYVIGSYGTGAIMAVPAHDERDFEFAVKKGLPIVNVITPDIVIVSAIQPIGKNSFNTTEEIAKKTQRILNSEEVYSGTGHLRNSGKFNGFDSLDAKQKIVQSVGGRMKVTYKLRDWLVSRQRYWGAPFPIVYDPEGNAHAIGEEHLPWLLPTDVEFKPTGVSPLGQSKELQERVEKIFGAGWRPEIDTMDTFVCSSWYYYRFADPRNMEEFASKELIKKWLPVDLYVGGAEHTVLHLLYARFFTKVLKDLGYISFDEPFKKLRHQGMILAEDGRKMSKSLGNVVNPDDVVREYGADTLRLYEMFMGPLEVMKPWNTKNIVGSSRFLERVWKLQEALTSEGSAETEVSLHRTIKKVGEDYEHMKFNTAIAALMIFVNDAEKFGVSKEQYATFLRVLAPLAPHITEELWNVLGNTESIHLSVWPEFDESKLVEDVITLGVQVNGKTRGTVALSKDVSEEDATAAAKEAVSKWLDGKEIKKTIYVAGRLVSFVVAE